MQRRKALALAAAAISVPLLAVGGLAVAAQAHRSAPGTTDSNHFVDTANQGSSTEESDDASTDPGTAPDAGDDHGASGSNEMATDDANDDDAEDDADDQPGATDHHDGVEDDDPAEPGDDH